MTTPGQTPLDRPVMFFDSATAWERWLDENHVSSVGVWLKMARKGSGIASVDDAGALDVALCYGWIDGQRRGFDETFFLQRFTPRRRGSRWSKVNVGHVERLTAAGRMRPAGQREVDFARADGRWEAAYASQSSIETPPDFQAALEARPAAATFFAGLSTGARYTFLYRIGEAKRPETRARRIAEYVEMLAAGTTLRAF